MLHHPLEMAHIEVGMLLALPFLCSIIGQLGWHDIKLWWPCAITYWLVVCWSTQIISGLPHRVSFRQRLVLAMAACGCWIAVFSLIYLTFTTVGAGSINGLQGRYMIPATLPFFLIFCSSGKKHEWAGRFIPAFSLMFTLYAVVVLVRRFYIW
jgi:uncharacterized membrane protein